MANSSETNLVNNFKEDSSYSSSPDSYNNSDISLESIQNVNKNGYKMYKRRWIGMIVIIGLNFVTSFVWLTFNAVSKISQKWLNGSLSEVNLSVMLYFLGSIVMNSFSGFVFEKWGIKRALIIGGVLNVIGTWIRYFGSFVESSEDSHVGRVTVVLIGQFIAASAQPFFLNAPPKYSAVWFSGSSRAIATTIGTVSNPLGAAIGMVIIPAICQNPDGDDMPLTLLVIGVISVVAIIPAFVMPNLPPTPPSASAEESERNDESFFAALKKVSKNSQFWILCTAFAVYVAIFNCISSLINQIVVPYGYSDDEAGLLGACLIASGIIGAAISGVYVDKTKQYKAVLKLATPLLAAGYITLIFVVQRDNFSWICVVCGAIGFVSFALLPVALELGVECTYPSPPSTSTSVLWLGGQTLGVIFLLVGDSLRNSSPYSNEPTDTLRTGLIVVAGVSSLTTLLSLGFNSPYYRMEAERDRNLQNDKHLAVNNI